MLSRSDQEIRASSLNVACESSRRFFRYFLQNLVEFLTQLVVIVLFELGPMAVLFLLFLLLEGELVQLLRDLAPFNEQLHLRSVLIPHVDCVRRIFSFQENGEQLKHCLLNGKCWVLQSIFTNFTKSPRHDLAKCLLHESYGIILLLKLVQEHWVLDGWHLDR